MNINNYPLWTAIITPMLGDGEVDYPGLAKLLKEQEEAENGVLLLGSTGESLNIDENERKKILHFALDKNLNVPIMVGVGGINLKETCAWVDYLETLRVDAYLMITPLYAKPGAEGQYQWFKTLLDRSKRPVMLYNVPSRTGVSLNVKTLAKLKTHPMLWAVKEASGKTLDFKNYRKAAPEVRFYSGDDAMMPDFAKLGAKGLVSVASNVWPKETHAYVLQSLDKSLKAVKLWKDCSNSLFTVH